MAKIDKSKNILRDWSLKLTFVTYTALAIAVIAFTAVASVGTGGIPCVFGIPIIVVWLGLDITTAFSFKAPICGVVLFGAIISLMTFSNLVYNKFSYSKKTIELEEHIKLDSTYQVKSNEINSGSSSLNSFILFDSFLKSNKQVNSEKKGLDKRPLNLSP